jgi:hypothetical protein
VVQPNTPQFEALTGDVKEEAINCYNHVLVMVEK